MLFSPVPVSGWSVLPLVVTSLLQSISGCALPRVVVSLSLFSVSSLVSPASLV